MQESQELNHLFEALAKAQADMDMAAKSSTNPFFKSKYSDLTSIVNASRDSLSKNGLSVIQRTLNLDGKSYLYTRLCHSSGQWIESNMEINPPKTDIQSLGSYITYIRRYSYASIVGVVTCDDDDGEHAVKITSKELDTINELLEGMEDYRPVVLKFNEVKDLKEIRNGNVSRTIAHLKEVRKKRGMDE